MEAGVLPALVKAMNGQNENEQESAAKIVWTLSFGNKTKDTVKISPFFKVKFTFPLSSESEFFLHVVCIFQVKENTDISKALDKLSKSSNKAVVKAASGALWQMKNEPNRKEVSDSKYCTN